MGGWVVGDEWREWGGSGGRMLRFILAELALVVGME